MAVELFWGEGEVFVEQAEEGLGLVDSVQEDSEQVEEGLAPEDFVQEDSALEDHAIAHRHDLRDPKHRASGL